MVILLIEHLYIIESYMARLVLKNKCSKDMVNDKIGPCAEIILTNVVKIFVNNGSVL